MNDNTDQIGYNIDNNVNDQWERDMGDETITGNVVERLDKQKFQTVTVAGCKHLRTEKDNTDETDGYYAIKCLDCPIGFLVKKTTS